MSIRAIPMNADKERMCPRMVNAPFDRTHQ